MPVLCTGHVLVIMKFAVAMKPDFWRFGMAGKSWELEQWAPGTPVYLQANIGNVDL